MASAVEVTGNHATQELVLLGRLQSGIHLAARILVAVVSTMVRGLRGAGSVLGKAHHVRLLVAVVSQQVGYVLLDGFILFRRVVELRVERIEECSTRGGTDRERSAAARFLHEHTVLGILAVDIV